MLVIDVDKLEFVEVFEMKCPLCGNEMELGKLRSKGGVFFLPDGEKMPKLYTQKEMAKHRAVSFPPFVLNVLPEYPSAYVCRECKKLIMDIAEE